MNLKWLPACLMATQLYAVDVDLGPTGVTNSLRLDFDNLNGTVLNGQTEALRLNFNNEVHLFSNTPTFFLISLSFTMTDVGLIDGTGFVLNSSGNRICADRPLNGAFSTSEFFVGLIPLWADDLGLLATDFQRPHSFYGVEFDFTLPNNGGQIQDGSLLLTNGPFRIGPHVPEDGMTLTLLVIALIILLSFYDKKTTR